MDVKRSADEVEPEASAAVLGLVLPAMLVAVHLPTRVVAGAIAVAIQLVLKVGLAPRKGTERHQIVPASFTTASPSADQIEVVPLALTKSAVPTPAQVARSGRCIGPRHAVRLPPRGLQTTELLHVRRVPFGQAAIGPVEAEQLGHGRPRDALKGRRLQTPFHLASDEVRTTGRPHVVADERRVIEEDDEDAPVVKAGSALLTVVLLHTTQIRAVGPALRVAPDEPDTQQLRLPWTQEHEPGVKLLGLRA